MNPMQMYFDDDAWAKSQSVLGEFKRKVAKPETPLGATKFMASYRPAARPTDRAQISNLGFFNFCYRMDFDDGFSSMLRFPCPGKIMFPGEEVRKEVAVMQFLKQNTSIPVPEIIDFGTSADSGPCNMGPFILMEYIERATDLTEAMRFPEYEENEKPCLDINIDETKLKFFYQQVADILLELSRHSFDKIGSLSKNHGAYPIWSVEERPSTMNMNELVQVGCFSRR